jgi:geranylgeranyl reductase family protein
MDDWDLVVVGGGPAGSTAALSALRSKPGARVLILDAAAFPRDKVCGDGIAPHALDILRDLDVDTDALTAGTDSIIRLQLRSPGGATVVRPFARPAYVVPRLLFDDRLMQCAITAGATLHRHRARTVVTTPGGVVIDDKIRARTVIGADGAESVVRRHTAAHSARPGTTAIALRGYAPAGHWPAREQLLTMTTSHWPAYAWVFPVGNGLANVGYGELLQGTVPSRAHLVQRLQALLPEAEPPTLRGHRLPLSTGRPDVGQGPVLLAGDAASLINPLTGEGIYYAVLSGALAGRAAFAPDPACTYRRTLRQALGRHLRHTDAIAYLGRWPSLLDLGIGAASNSQHAFDHLVEIGLGSGLIDVRTARAIGGYWLRQQRERLGFGSGTKD